MTRVLVLVALGVAVLGACEAPQDLCGYLDDAIERCNLPATTLDCSAAEETAKAVIAKRLADADCKGLADQNDGTAVDPRLCALAGWSCPEPPTPPPGPGVPTYPLVLVSGIDGTAVFDWHPAIGARLRDEGVRVQEVKVLPWATTAARADDLWQSLQSLRARFGTKLNLVCWAVGGLDCRYVVSPHGLFRDDEAGQADAADAIASITTIATPHRGTRVAEAARAALDNGNAQELLAALVGSPVEVPDDATLAVTLDGLTPQALYDFNQVIDDAPGVVYESWAGVSFLLGKSSRADQALVDRFCVDDEGAPAMFQHPDAPDTSNPLFWVTSAFSGASNDDDGRTVTSPSDGMIAVASAKWGRFRGCLPADHYDLVGQIGHTTRDPITGFDAAVFYRKVAADLAARGL